MFLEYAIKPMETFLTVNETYAPQIANIISGCKRLIGDLMVKLSSQQLLGATSLWKKLSFHWINQESEKELLIAEECQRFIDNKAKNGMSESSLKCFYVNVKKFSVAVLSYLLKKLPLNDKVLSKLSVSDPRNHNTISVTHTKYLLDRFPILIPCGLSHDDVAGGVHKPSVLWY